MNEQNELLALARQVASLRHELGFESADKELYKVFIRMIDELTDTIFKQQGDRNNDLF
jgi:hypothetical protein